MRLTVLMKLTDLTNLSLNLVQFVQDGVFSRPLQTRGKVRRGISEGEEGKIKQRVNECRSAQKARRFRDNPTPHPRKKKIN